MTSKDFIVKIIANDWDADWALTLENVQRVMTDAIGFRGDFVIDSVVEFNQADYTLTRYGKIHAIKEVRNLIQCTLLEGKTLVDAASTRAGTSNMFGVSINYDPAFEPNAYHVKRTA